MIKSLNKGKHTSSAIVDGCNNDKDIAERFKDIYKSLYNSVPDERLNNVSLQVKQLIETKCLIGNCLSPSCHSVNVSTVKDAAKSLAKGKKDETYDMNSNHFIYGPECLFIRLASLFEAMIIHGCCDSLLNRSVIKPIPKSKSKSCCDSSNYRAISLIPIISKLLDYVIISLMEDKLSTSHLQFAYKSDSSTALCTFLVIETIQYYRSRGSSVYALLLDATKAFDKVKFSKLFELLITRNVCPLLIRLL